MSIPGKILSIILKCAFVAAICACNTVHAQISDSLYKALPDSLKPANRAALTDREKQKLISSVDIDIQNRYTADFDALILWLKQKANNAHTPAEKINLLSQTGYYYYGHSKDSSILYYKKALSYTAGAPEFNDEAATAYRSIGRLYYYLENYDSSIFFLHSALDVTPPKDTASLIACYAIYSLIYGQYALYNEAIDYDKKILRLTNSASFATTRYVQDLLNEATDYCGLYGKTQENVYRDTALSIVNTVMANNKADSASWYQYCYYLKGLIAFKGNDYVHAIVLFDSSMLPAYNLSSRYSANYSFREYLYKAVSLVRLGQYAQGLTQLEKITIGPKNYLLKQTAYQALSEAADKLGATAKALRYYTQYKLYTDSLEISDHEANVLLAEQKFQAGLQQATIIALENSNLRVKNARDKIIIFGVLAVSMLIIATMLLYQRNRRQLLQKELALANQRKDISANMHDEVSSSLAALRYLINDLKDQATDAGTRQVLEEIEGEANAVYTQARNSIHQIRTGAQTENYSTNNLLHRLALRFTIDSSVQINVDADEIEIDKYFTPIQHEEITRVITEAVTNSIKHSGCDTITISVKKKGKKFYFDIADNGKWAGDNNATTGMGLNTITQRIKTLKGDVTITGTENGTHISGSFPVQGKRFLW